MDGKKINYEIRMHRLALVPRGVHFAHSIIVLELAALIALIFFGPQML